MNKETADALEASIEKWKRNEERWALDSATYSRRACPLCVMFVNATGTCLGCPVTEATGFPSCAGTPYGDASDALHDGDVLAFKRHARREREFLESLRESDDD